MPSNENTDQPIIKKSHWRIIITAGMGFFTDAYDLFIIGIITAILIPLWHLSTIQISLFSAQSNGIIIYDGNSRMKGLSLEASEIVNKDDQPNE